MYISFKLQALLQYLYFCSYMLHILSCSCIHSSTSVVLICTPVCMCGEEQWHFKCNHVRITLYFGNCPKLKLLILVNHDNYNKVLNNYVNILLYFSCTVPLLLLSSDTTTYIVHDYIGIVYI